MNLEGASGSNPLRLVFRGWRLATILPALLLVRSTCAFPLDPSLDISQYAHTAWKIRDGFFKGVITSIAQTPDGYLWVGTGLGLLRFDGVRAAPWRPPPNRQLPSNSVDSLLAARDRTLWIGTSKGLASLMAGKLTVYPQLAGLRVQTLLEDHEGTVWAGGFAYTPPGKLCAIRNGDVHCYGEDGRFGNGVLGLYEDSHRNLWTGVLNGFWRWKPGPPHFFGLTGESYGIQSFAEDQDGTLLIPIRDRVARLSNGLVETAYRCPGTSRQNGGERILRDRDGVLWMGTWSQGIVHVREGAADTFGQRDGLSGDLITALLEDREGNIWVGTTKGLDRFRAYSVATFSEPEGFSSGGSTSALVGRDGSIWFSPHGRLFRFDRGQITIYHEPGGIAPVADEERRARAVSVDGLPELAVASLFQDNNGRIWVAATGGVGYLQNKRFVPVNTVPGGVVDAIAGDAKGNLWISIVDRGLFHLFGDKLVQHFPWAVLGRNDLATALAVDPSRGGVWLGFSKGGLAWLAEGRIRPSFVADPAFDQGRVSDLRFDHNGVLWVSSDGGFSRIKDGRVSTLTTKNGLPCNQIYWLTEGEDHSFWLYGSCGLIRIAGSDLEARFATSKNTDPKPVRATLFDETDGVTLSTTLTGSPGFRGMIAPDGKIWFPTLDGLSVIDPRHIPFNNVPPPVHIEQVIADDKTYDVSAGMRLPAQSRDVTIDFTALSLVAPEKVRFRVKLEGQDKDWRELVNERRVRYTNLPPRHYRFRVLAANNSGVWNEAGDSLDFDIPPAWYQTMWFHEICIGAFMALLWAVYQLRVHQLQEQEKKFREAVETMPALAFVVDTEGNRTFLNRRWLEYTGLSSEQASGLGWERAVHPDDLNRVLERWRTSQKSGQHLDYEVRLRRGSDGVYRWFQARAEPLHDRRGKIVKWCAVASDIEDRKRAEQLQADLTHANRVSTMGELVASISHELAQPITATTNNAKASLRWLQRDPPDLTQVRKGTESIIEAGAFASEIINRLRSLYRKSSPKRELVAINEVIGDMAGMLRSEARCYGVSIRTDLMVDLPMTVADRVQLQQVLMNLMLNGIEAMSETGGVITVKSQLNNQGQIHISVNDTGAGLPDGKADQLFEAFFTTKPQGSGMGLAICKSIVESHGGRIWASENGGRGATFHLNLPVAPAEENPPEDAA
jgi:PAS domain S-box-containing protein